MNATARTDEGSAVAEFAAVSALLALLFAGVVQLAIVQHVRATAADSAGEGARYGAMVGRTPADGADRTRELLAGSLSQRFADDVTARRVELGDLDVVEIDVRAPLPLMGFLGAGRGLHVQGHSVIEEP